MKREMNEDLLKYMASMMSDEEKHRLRTIGEKFYSSFDIDKGSLYQTTSVLPTDTLEEGLAYLVEQMKAGLHPRYLKENEVRLLESGYGKEWYTKWGWTEDDAPVFDDMSRGVKQSKQMKHKKKTATHS